MWAPGFDIFTSEIMKMLLQEPIVKIINIINSSFKLKYVPKMWMITEDVMIPKPGKHSGEDISFRHISLFLKFYEQLINKILKPIIDERELIFRETLLSS